MKSFIYTLVLSILFMGSIASAEVSGNPDRWPSLTLDLLLSDPSGHRGTDENQISVVNGNGRGFSSLLKLPVWERWTFRLGVSYFNEDVEDLFSRDPMALSSIKSVRYRIGLTLYMK